MQIPFDPREQLVVELFVSNIERSLHFYRELGFEAIRVEDGFAELAWEGCLLLLDERTDLPAPGARPRANVRVLVTDVNAAWERAQGLGATVWGPIGDRSYGLRDFTILDPDGFGVRFASPLTR